MESLRTLIGSALLATGLLVSLAGGVLIALALLAAGHLRAYSVSLAVLAFPAGLGIAFLGGLVMKFAQRFLLPFRPENVELSVDRAAPRRWKGFWFQVALAAWSVFAAVVTPHRQDVPLIILFAVLLWAYVIFLEVRFRAEQREHVSGVTIRRRDPAIWGWIFLSIWSLVSAVTSNTVLGAWSHALGGIGIGLWAMRLEYKFQSGADQVGRLGR